MELKDSKLPKPQSDEDWLTVELRNEFALLNKICELREIAKDASKKKLNRKAAKAAIKEQKRREKANPSLKAPKLKMPAKPVPSSSTEWIKTQCWRCDVKFAIHSTWEKPPTLCKACAKDLDETYLSSGPDHSTPFSKVHFVSGGAPGSGKRR